MPNVDGLKGSREVIFWWDQKDVLFVSEYEGANVF